MRINSSEEKTGFSDYGHDPLTGPGVCQLVKKASVHRQDIPGDPARQRAAVSVTDQDGFHIRSMAGSLGYEIFSLDEIKAGLIPVFFVSSFWTSLYI